MRRIGGKAVFAAVLAGTFGLAALSSPAFAETSPGRVLRALIPPKDAFHLPGKKRTRAAPPAGRAHDPAETEEEPGSAAAAPVPKRKPGEVAPRSEAPGEVVETAAAPVGAMPAPRAKPDEVETAAAPTPEPLPEPAGEVPPDLFMVRAGVLPPPKVEAPLAKPLADRVETPPLAFAPSPLPEAAVRADPLMGLVPPRRPEPPSAAANIIAAAFPPAEAPRAPEGLAACQAMMGRLAIEASARAPVHDGACGSPAPYDVSALEGGAVTLSPPATINCAMATTLARFLQQDIQPAAIAAFGQKVTALRIADSYSCRGRNRVVGAKLSEHAFMNAVDIGAFKIGDRWVEVAKGGDQSRTEADFVQIVRKAGCKHFTTVLGHGSDGYHENHLHFDLRQRGKKTRVYCH